MTPVEVKLVQPEALVIGEGDRLIVRVPEWQPPTESDADLVAAESERYDLAQGIHMELERIGLADRAMILIGDLEINVVRKEAA